MHSFSFPSCSRVLHIRLQLHIGDCNNPIQYSGSYLMPHPGSYCWKPSYNLQFQVSGLRSCHYIFNSSNFASKKPSSPALFCELIWHCCLLCYRTNTCIYCRGKGLYRLIVILSGRWEGGADMQCQWDCWWLHFMGKWSFASRASTLIIWAAVWDLSRFLAAIMTWPPFWAMLSAQ